MQQNDLFWVVSAPPAALTSLLLPESLPLSQPSSSDSSSASLLLLPLRLTAAALITRPSPRRLFFSPCCLVFHPLSAISGSLILWRSLCVFGVERLLSDETWAGLTKSCRRAPCEYTSSTELWKCFGIVEHLSPRWLAKKNCSSWQVTERQLFYLKCH